MRLLLVGRRPVPVGALGVDVDQQPVPARHIHGLGRMIEIWPDRVDGEEDRLAGVRQIPDGLDGRVEVVAAAEVPGLRWEGADLEELAGVEGVGEGAPDLQEVRRMGRVVCDGLEAFHGLYTPDNRSVTRPTTGPPSNQ